MFYHFPVDMRAAPTLGHNGTGNFQLTDYVTFTNVTAISTNVANSTSRFMLVEFAVAAGLTAFRPMAVRAAAVAAILDFSAEL